VTYIEQFKHKVNSNNVHTLIRRLVWLDFLLISVYLIHLTLNYIHTWLIINVLLSQKVKIKLPYGFTLRGLNKN